MDKLREAATAALAQLEINRTNFRKGPSKSICKMLAGGNDEIITALRTALAEQPAEQEWDGSCVMGHCGSPSGCEIDGYCRVDRCSAPPPRREVELTDEEIFAVENNVPDEVISDRDWAIWYARAVIEAYKAKQEKT